MKTLKEYILETISCSKNYNFTYKQANDYYQNNIVESLYHSHDTDTVVQNICKKYNIKEDDVFILNKHFKKTVFIVPQSYLYKYVKTGEFIDYLLKHGYYIGYNFEGFYYIEPIYTENITDIIQDNCNGKIYKLVDNSVLNKIKSSEGLYTDKDDIYKTMRVKLQDKSTPSNIKKLISKNLSSETDIRLNKFIQGDKSYRQYYSRLYFFSGESKSSLKDAYEYLTKSFSETGNNINNCSILEIDVSKYNVKCYVDTMYDINYRNNKWWFLYINAFFPLELITIYTPEEFNNTL